MPASRKQRTGMRQRKPGGKGEAISSRLHPLSTVRNRRLGAGRRYEGSSDGRASMASRQLGQRRFCRRSQLSNTSSQRRQVVGPAYAVGFGGFCLRRGGIRRMAVLSGERWHGGAGYRPLTPYRPPPLTTEGQASWARDTVHIRLGHPWIHHSSRCEGPVMHLDV